MKRIISLILLIMVIMTIQPTVYSNETKYFLKKLEIMQGDENGNFREDDTLSREEFVKMTIKILEPDFIATSSISPYSDVVYSSWSAGYIQRASELGYFTGFPDGSFRPYDKVLPEQLCKIMLKILGYETENTTANWAQNQILIAKSKGILDNIEYQISNPISRINAAKIIKNTLLSKKNKSVQFYIEDMGYKYYEDVIIISDKNVKNGYISTTIGAFKKGNISAQNIQKQGDIVVDNENEIILFLSAPQNENSYIVKTVLQDSIIVFDNKTEKMLKFDDDVTVYDGNITLLYKNLLPSLKLGDKIDVYYDDMMNINYLLVTRDAILGPITNFNESYKNQFNVTENSSVNRDGMVSNTSAIKELDICYYIKEVDTILVYSNKSIGVYENAYPNKDNVQRIILSGKEYEIGSEKAFSELSTNGNINYGETIKVLFGKDGKIADVVKMKQEENLVGFLIDTGQKSRVNENNKNSFEYFAEVLLIDGKIQEFYTNRDYENIEGTVVSVSFSEGKAKLSGLPSQNNISGIFNWDTKMLGSEKISENINIIDVASHNDYKRSKGEKIYPQRLNKTEITTKDVIYINNDKNNVITDIILNDYTNDLYDYGIVLKDERLSNKYIINGTYDLNVNGKNTKIITQNSLYSVYTGQPIKLDFDNNNLISMIKLNKLTEPINKVDEIHVYSQTNKHLISDDVLVYKGIINSSNDIQRYEIIPINKIYNTENVTVYYDKPEINGGRIRVILIK